MTLSRQRLEDNPTNYDGAFDPSSSPSYASTSSLLPVNLPPGFDHWKIYPPPPEPHWKEVDPLGEAPTDTTEEIAAREEARRRFEWSECDIPQQEPEAKRRRFALDDNGVYQVYHDGAFSLFHRPRRRPSRARADPDIQPRAQRRPPRPNLSTPCRPSRSTFRISTTCSRSSRTGPPSRSPTAACATSRASGTSTSSSMSTRSWPR